mmetsp:Transcript_5568/g.15968  ORF Transcript_5568/g.15968 Transcript_5568/m.15968 type:complete len:93 (-) Transcript_5568:88-366(-)
MGALGRSTSCKSSRRLRSQALLTKWENSSVRRKALRGAVVPVSLEEREKRLEDVRQRLRNRVRGIKVDIFPIVFEAVDLPSRVPVSSSEIAR